MFPHFPPCCPVVSHNTFVVRVHFLGLLFLPSNVRGGSSILRLSRTPLLRLVRQPNRAPGEGHVSPLHLTVDSFLIYATPARPSHPSSLHGLVLGWRDIDCFIHPDRRRLLLRTRGFRGSHYSPFQPQVHPYPSTQASYEAPDPSTPRRCLPVTYDSIRLFRPPHCFGLATEHDRTTW